MAKNSAAKMSEKAPVIVVSDPERAAFKTIAEVSRTKIVRLARSSFLFIPPFKGGPASGYYPTLWNFQWDTVEEIDRDLIDVLRDAYGVVGKYLSTGDSAFFTKHGNEVQLVDRTTVDGFHQIWPTDAAGKPRCLLFGFDLSEMNHDGYWYFDEGKLSTAQEAVHARKLQKQGSDTTRLLLGFEAANGREVGAITPAIFLGSGLSIVVIREAEAEDKARLKKGGRNTNLKALFEKSFPSEGA